MYCVYEATDFSVIFYDILWFGVSYKCKCNLLLLCWHFPTHMDLNYWPHTKRCKTVNIIHMVRSGKWKFKKKEDRIFVVFYLFFNRTKQLSKNTLFQKIFTWWKNYAHRNTKKFLNRKAASFET